MYSVFPEIFITGLYSCPDALGYFIVYVILQSPHLNVLCPLVVQVVFISSATFISWANPSSPK